MRTLVLGIPLPHVTFDNFSFISAPSLFDYDQLIVDVSAISDAVQQVTDGAVDKITYGTQTVVNGPGGPGTFSLAELLRLRRLEAERFLARGGIIVCMAYPDVAHRGIVGLPVWRRYDWLPAPEGYTYAELLIPGYGKRGVQTVDAEHAFAPYIDQFGARLAFRAYLPEQEGGATEHARIFARSPGGAAVGVELDVGAGRIVLLPPLASLDYSKDRTPLAGVLHDCLERAQVNLSDKPSQWIRKEAS